MPNIQSCETDTDLIIIEFSSPLFDMIYRQGGPPIMWRINPKRDLNVIFEGMFKDEVEEE